MQNVERELPVLINNLLQSPADKQRHLIEAYYAPDCRLTHALVSRKYQKSLEKENKKKRHAAAAEEHPHKFSSFSFLAGHS